MEVPGLPQQASSSSSSSSSSSARSSPSIAAEGSIRTFLKGDSVITKNKKNPPPPNFKHPPWLDRLHPSLCKDVLTLHREDLCNTNLVQRKQVSQVTKKKRKREPVQGTKVKKAENDWETLSLEQVLASLEAGQLLQLSINDLLYILYKCRKTKNVGCVLRLHAYLCSRELEVHATLGNYVVSSLVELGSIHDAQQVFDRLSHRTQCSWNSLITHYVKFGEFKRAFDLYQNMQADGTVLPSRHTFIALLKVCAKLKDNKRGCILHDDINRTECLTRDVFVGSSLIDMYAKCGLVKEAQEVFDTLPNTDVVSWNALIGGYANQGCAQEALNCFERMEKECVLPNAVTFVCTLKACHILGATHKGHVIYAQVMKTGLLEEDNVIGNAIVDMYAKCGLLASARMVFDNLVVRDVISWTSIITAYARCECNEEALTCFEQMQLAGVSPNVVTYASILKACGNAGCVEMGRELHADIVRKGLQKEHIVGTALVGMYAECGLFEHALEVFETLLVQDVVSWNALIAGYVKHDHFAKALSLFNHMQEDGVFPDAITFVCCLKACGRSVAADKGQELHAEIAEKGMLEKDYAIGNALVDMYAKCGLLAKAQDVFDKLTAHNVITWNALIAGYAEHGEGNVALNCFKQMQVNGICPNATTFVCCLKACGSMGDVDQGQELHNEVSSKGLEQDFIISSSLVDMYCKCGVLAKAQEVFDNLSGRDVISWTSLVRGYVEYGDGEKALACFKQMQQEGASPDAVTFVCSLKACGSIGAADKGQKIHAQIVGEEWFGKHLDVSTALIDMYAQCNLLTLAQDVFDKLSVRDVASWNALIAGYAEHGYGHKALSCFDQMEFEEISPTSATYIWVLKACGNLRLSDQILKLYTQIVVEGLDTDYLVASALINMFAECGMLAKAQEVFDDLPVRDGVLWTALIAAYAENERGEEALICFEKMQHEGFASDGVAFVCSLKACGNIGAIEKGQELHAQINSKGLLQQDIILGNALVDMYAKCGLLAKAREVFGKLPARHVIAWSALIAGYAQLGETENVSQLFHSMIEEGQKPNAITFLSVLNACCHAGLVDGGQMYFESMRIDHGVVPTLEHHNCMVDILSRAGQLETALAMIEKFVLDPNFVVWQTVLSACQKGGYIEIGKQVFEHTIVMNESASAYVCMSNMYTEADQWS